MIKRREGKTKHFLVVSLCLFMMIIAVYARNSETAPEQELLTYPVSIPVENYGEDRAIAKPGEILIRETITNETLIYHLFDSDGENVWLQDVVDQQAYGILDISFGDGRYYLHSMIDFDKTCLICLDESGSLLWQKDLAPHRSTDRIVPLSAGGVGIFSISYDDHLSISYYSPTGKRTPIVAPAELQNVHHIYEAASGADGCFWLRCRYREPGREEMQSALFILDSSFQVRQRMLMPVGEWVDRVYYQTDTKRFFVYVQEWGYDTTTRSEKGYWLLLDKDLQLLYRQGEAAAISGIVGLSEGRFLIYLSPNNEEKTDNIFVYSEDFSLLESRHDERHVRIYDSSSGGYYTVEEPISQTVEWPLYSSLLPHDMFIRKYDEQNQLCWEKTYFVEANVPHLYFEMKPVKQIGFQP